jgi:UDP-2-acetamido-3-amino-2,3-dideoxy-glucuronate N-acetyltransferase
LTTSPSIAVIGAGYWGRNLVRNMHALGVLHTISDASPEIRAQMAEQYQGVELVADTTDVFNNAEIKAVVIATPAATHYDQVEAALNAGKDVMVEKPLCLHAADGAKLVKLAKQKNRILMVGHLLWYHPAVLKLRELIANGELGKLRYISSNRLNMGKLRREENVLWSFAPHDISVIQGLVGEQPEFVRASGGAFLDRSVADVTLTELTFSNGIHAFVFVSWLHPFKEQKLVVVGERQMAVFDDRLDWDDKLRLYPHDVTWGNGVPEAKPADALPVSLDSAEPLRNECEHFLECVQTRSKPRTDGIEALAVLDTLERAEMSLQKSSAGQQQPDGGSIHETAIVDDGVTVGAGTHIWHFSHILGETSIGKNCTIGQNVMIGPRVNVGNGCKIQNNVSIYEGVTLEDEVFCGPSCVFTNVNNPRANVPRRNEFRQTVVHQGASIGANATIVCGNNLGPYSFVGAGAVITKDVQNNALMVGNPAVRIGWMCDCGERLPETLVCQSCTTTYSEADGTLEKLS